MLIIRQKIIRQKTFDKKKRGDIIKAQLNMGKIISQTISSKRKYERATELEMMSQSFKTSTLFVLNLWLFFYGLTRLKLEVKFSDVLHIKS
jgi:hypothetical protein